MADEPKLDKRQTKMKYRLSMMYALLVLVTGVILALVLSMKPIDGISSKRDSMNIKLLYFEGNIDTEGSNLSESDSSRINALNNNDICVSSFKSAEMTEESAKNFLLSWLYVRYPGLDITEDSVIYKESKWRKSHEACQDTYLSNVFQYDKRKAQTDVTMDNIVENWMKSGLIVFLGVVNIITVLWFISIHRKELDHYNTR